MCSGYLHRLTRSVLRSGANGNALKWMELSSTASWREDAQITDRVAHFNEQFRRSNRIARRRNWRGAAPELRLHWIDWLDDPDSGSLAYYYRERENAAQ